LDQPIWKWISSLLAVAVTIGLLWLAWRVGCGWDRHASERGGWQVGQPLVALVAIAALAGLEVVQKDAVLFRRAPGGVLAVAIIVARYVVLA
jgi:hypothetical protein